MLKLGKKVLIFIGKPFYKVLTVLVIAVLSLLYFIGHLIIILPSKIKLPEAKKVKKFKIKKIPSKRLKPIKISFPKIKIKLPDVRTFFKLLRLRILLRLEFLFSKIKSLLKFKKLKVKIGTKFVIVFGPALIFVIAFYFLILRGLPSPRELTSRQLDVSTKIYDRNEVLLYKIYKNENRTPISLSDIPLHVRLATLAAEDAEFYSHPGFSVKGIIRAAIRNVQTGDLSGGSTITQQLVKDALLTPERTLTRKLKELVLAVGVEHTFSKDQILEMYLNEVSYGGTAYGIKEGAQEYFSKDVKDLTLSEACYLAGLIKSPTKLSPFGGNPDLAIEREKEVIHLMKVNKFITAEEETEALNEPIVIKPGNRDIKAPHFVMYVRQELVDKYGEDMVEKGGLEVTTTLDYQIQQMAEKVVNEEVDKLKGLNVGNGAAIVMAPTNGQILAMVGSKDYFDPNGGNVNVTLRERQPGSSIKIVNYAYALSHGYTPASIIDDSPTTFIVPGLPPYSPVNYDGKFFGKISLRSALAESRNIPAVKVLASYGVSKMLDLGKNMGITTWTDPSKYGLSLTLGGGDVKLIDLARVFATIANSGKRPNTTSILSIKDYKGNVLQENTCANQGQPTQAKSWFNALAEEKDTNGCDTPQIIDPGVAFLLTNILSDNNARAPEFGSYSSLVVANHPEVAVKTGTSNNLKDNLTVGFNQKYLVAVWVGNNDSSPMSRIASGVTGAAPIWNRIISSLLANEKSTAWNIPEDVIQKDCFGRSEWFLTSNVPSCNPPPTPAPSPTSIPQILEPAARIEVKLP